MSKLGKLFCGFLSFCYLAIAMLGSLLIVGIAQAAELKIGLMAPLTGKWASEGLDMKNIVELLADQINKQGGINGDKINLIIVDDAGDPRTAAIAAQKLASAEVIATVGTYGSAVTEASQIILAEADIVQIATGSTSVRLTEKKLPFFLRTCPRDDDQGKAAAKFILDKNYKNIAILHDNSSYSSGLAQEARKHLESAGAKIVFYDALTPGEQDYTAVLTRLKSTEAEVLFFTGYYPETGMLLRQKKELGYNIQMLGGDASNHQDLVKVAGVQAAEGYSFISPPLPQDIDTESAKVFLRDFLARYQAMPVSIWAVLAGDAFKAIVAGLEAGNKTPETLANWLKQQKNLPGLTGDLGFNEKGDRIGEFYRSYSVNQEGKFILQPLATK